MTCLFCVSLCRVVNALVKCVFMLLIIIECACAVFFPVSLLTVKNKGCQWRWKIVRCFILLILFTFPHLSAQFRHQRNDSGRYLRQSMRINAPSMALSRNFFNGRACHCQRPLPFRFPLSPSHLLRSRFPSTPLRSRPLNPATGR